MSNQKLSSEGLAAKALGMLSRPQLRLNEASDSYEEILNAPSIPEMSPDRLKTIRDMLKLAVRLREIETSAELRREESVVAKEVLQRTRDIKGGFGGGGSGGYN